MNEKFPGAPIEPTAEELERQKAELEERLKDPRENLWELLDIVNGFDEGEEKRMRLAEINALLDKQHDTQRQIRLAAENEEIENRKALSEYLKPYEQEEQVENVQAWLKRYETPEVPEPEKETSPRAERLKKLIADFEANYPLEELHAITELTKEEIENHPLRTPAKKALIPIVELVNKLKGTSEYEALKAEYMRLSRAVGMINSGKVDHER